MVASPGFVTRNVPDDRRLFTALCEIRARWPSERCYPFYFIQKVAIVNALSYANGDGLTVSLSHEQFEKCRDFRKSRFYLAALPLD